ncbi:MAG: aminoacyl-tRNA hydrolase [Lachnospiraceae bacterium]|nr:aminoacyl-tRNA hydrolase [Lachnospiraceae bacterium]
MYLIAGLGNPTREYAGTRHNIGYDTITRLCDEYRISLDMKKHKGLCGKGVIEGEKVLLVQPLTYMNLSGDCIKEAADFYKIDPAHIIVIYDDISLPVGKLRVRAKGSAGGHNGMKSIIARLGTEEFARVRIGIGEKPAGWDLADYVLGRFQTDELPLMREAVGNAAKACGMILKDGIETAMNRSNSL